MSPNINSNINSNRTVIEKKTNQIDTEFLRAILQRYQGVKKKSGNDIWTNRHFVKPINNNFDKFDLDLFFKD